MIVDCHTHINCSGDNIDTTEHLAMTETIDACIVLADPEQSNTDANKKLADYVGKYKEKMIGFAYVEPTQEKALRKKIANLIDKLGLSGAVFYCSKCGFHPTHSKAMLFYEMAEQRSMPVFFHNGEPLDSSAILEYAQPFLLDEVARQFPELKIIIGSMGRPFVEQTLAMIAKHENVYADLTISPGNVWQTYNTVLSAHEMAVMDKLLFGSGFPLGKANECMETLLGFNKLLADTNLPTVPRDSIRNIIERNTLEVLGINLEPA
jgi:predicted TIM-barrel fold metal-dependent hydrolase